MKKIVPLMGLVVAAAMMIGVPVGPAGADLSQNVSIWVVDDVTKMTYNVTPSGSLNFKFDVPNSAFSSVDVDNRNGTLWGANEGSNKIVNYSFEQVNGIYQAVVLEEIFLDSIGSFSSEGISVALSDSDDTLWIVDDVGPGDPGPNGVYNITREGVLLSWFPTEAYDPASTSPQSIAFDPFDQTLWIADNSAEAVYHVSRTGALISRFDTDAGPFVTADNPSGLRNVQGISVESADVLWLTARDTGKVYRVNKEGTQVVSSFATSSFDPASSNPTGVSVYFPRAVDLGAAGDFTALGLPGAKVKIKDEGSGVVGDVGLALQSEQDFDNGLLTGALVVDPGADNSQPNDVVILDGVATADLTTATNDALQASGMAASLIADQTFDEIKSTTTIVGGTGRTVIRGDKIELDNGETLTLAGNSSSQFIINLTDKIKLKDGSRIVLVGGVRAQNVLFNVTAESDSAIEGGSVAYGTILAPRGKVKVKGPGSLLVGALIAGDEVVLEDWGRVRSVSQTLDAGDLGAATTASAIALPGAKLKLEDDPSTVDGDALLTPFAKQEFTSGVVTGTYRVDASAESGDIRDVVIQGGTTVEQLSRAAADAMDTAYLATSLAPTQTFGDIKSTATITGGPGLNVISVKKIDLKDGRLLTLTGDPSSRFILNVDEEVVVKEGAAIVTGGGVQAGNVLINVTSDRDSAVESGGSIQGTILTVRGKLKVKGVGSVVFGRLIGGREVVLEDGGRISG